MWKKDEAKKKHIKRQKRKIFWSKNLPVIFTHFRVNSGFFYDYGRTHFMLCMYIKNLFHVWLMFPHFFCAVVVFVVAIYLPIHHYFTGNPAWFFAYFPYCSAIWLHLFHHVHLLIACVCLCEFTIYGVLLLFFSRKYVQRNANVSHVYVYFQQ